MTDVDASAPAHWSHALPQLAPVVTAWLAIVGLSRKSEGLCFRADEAERAANGLFCTEVLQSGLLHPWNYALCPKPPAPMGCTARRSALSTASKTSCGLFFIGITTLTRG